MPEIIEIYDVTDVAQKCKSEDHLNTPAQVKTTPVGRGQRVTSVSRDKLNRSESSF